MDKDKILEDIGEEEEKDEGLTPAQTSPSGLGGDRKWNGKHFINYNF